jgi:hypothetical protein
MLVFTDRKIHSVRGIVWAVALGILTLTITRAVEHSASGLASDAVSPAGSKSGRILESDNYEQPGMVFFGVLADVAPFVHASFLRFDFKQNLRHWPLLVGDISRSPPFFAAL